MLLNFRQGIVDGQRNAASELAFLQVTTTGVHILATNKPLILNIAHGQSDYLVAIEHDVRWAWPALPSITPLWLFVDVNPSTGVVSYNHTSHQPVDGLSAPTQPQQDQHWFDTQNTKMRVWNGATWVEKIRLFVGTVYNQTSASIPASGSHVGLSGASRAVGKIVYDNHGRPIRKSDGELFTTEDDMYVNGVVSAPNTLETKMVTVTAGETIPAFSVVRFSTFGEVRLARYEDTGERNIAFSFGAIPRGDDGAIIFGGIVENLAWNFSKVDSFVWVDANGQIVDINPLLTNQSSGPRPPVGRVLSPTSIRFDPPSVSYEDYQYDVAETLSLVDLDTGDVLGLPLRGPSGAAGLQGPAGPSAYQSAIDNGFVGSETQWLTSIVGPQGIPGPSGPTGPTGPQGAVGPMGVDGAQGNPGPQGDPGPRGPAGSPGLPGAQGLQGVPGKSAYQTAVDNGFVGSEAQWLASIKGATGAAGAQGPAGPTGPQGPQGIPGPTGPAGPQGPQGLQGIQGAVGPVGPVGASGLPGTNGTNGTNGKSAYQTAVDNGYTGSEVQWLASLRGTSGAAGVNGESAYQLAVSMGFAGTEAQWIDSLHGANGLMGADGINGKSAYEIALDNGFVGTESDWLLSIQGTSGNNGTNGTNGTNGKSAYQTAVDNGFVGTEAQWLASLHGTDGTNGKSAYEIALDNGFIGTESDWLLTFQGGAGAAGADGKSAYQTAIDNGFVGTEAQWLTSLHGVDGTNGTAGKSAYQTAVDNGFTGTEAQWLTSLHGADGANGKTAYQSALDNGFVGTEAQWIDSLHGTNGTNGKTAYQSALDNGFVGTEAQWIDSLHGLNGTNGVDGTNGTAGKSAYQTAVDNGFTGTEAQWLTSLHGVDGANGTAGKSAYQTAIDNGFVGTEVQWLNSMQGTNGTNGTDGTNGTAGKSAYQTAVDNGFTGTEAQWLTSLHGVDGANGAPGPTGATGPAGTPGIDGVGMPTGGAAAQILTKVSAANYDIAWSTFDYANIESAPALGDPTGFVDRTTSQIAFVDASRTFTITPTNGSYDVFVRTKKFTKSGQQSITLPNVTGLYYIYFDDTGTIASNSSGFVVGHQAPISIVYWNTDINSSTLFGDERHSAAVPGVMHKALHFTQGAQYADGLDAINFSTVGTGGAATDAQIGLTSGAIYDEDIEIRITHSATPSAPFEQILSTAARIPVIYRGNTGSWFKNGGGNYPLRLGSTLPQYNTFDGTNWSQADAGNGSFIAMYIVATNDVHNPIVAIMGQRQDSNYNNAIKNNTWESLSLTDLPTPEMRPLYRVLFETRTSYTNTAHAAIREVTDLRHTAASVIQTVAGNQTTTLTPATTTSLGGVIVGSGLTVDSQGVIATATAPSTLIRRKVTATNGAASCRINIVAMGSQSDLDAVVITSTGALIAFSSVAPTLHIQSVSIAYDSGFNPNTYFGIQYPDLFGDTVGDDMVIPIMHMFNETGTSNSVMQATTNQNFSISNGVVQVQKTGLVANTAYRFKFSLI